MVPDVGDRAGEAAVAVEQRGDDGAPFAGRSRPYTLLYPDGRHVPLRMRVFIDFLMAQRPG